MIPRWPGESGNNVHVEEVEMAGTCAKNGGLSSS